jgi:hypothetical protein
MKCMYACMHVYIYTSIHLYIYTYIHIYIRAKLMVREWDKNGNLSWGYHQISPSIIPQLPGSTSWSFFACTQDEKHLVCYPLVN